MNSTEIVLIFVYIYAPAAAILMDCRPKWMTRVWRLSPWWSLPIVGAVAPFVLWIHCIVNSPKYALAFLRFIGLQTEKVSLVPKWAKQHETRRDSMRAQMNSKKARAKAQGGALSEADFNGGELSEVKND